MKKQILLTVMWISLLPAFAIGAQGTGGFDMAFCDRFVMNNTPTYSTMCEDANLYDSHMAEFKARSLQAVMRYVWKTAKRKDRKARFAGEYAYVERYDAVYAYDKGNKYGRGDRARESAKDAKVAANSFFKEANYRLRVNRHKFIMKLSVKY